MSKGTSSPTIAKAAEDAKQLKEKPGANIQCCNRLSTIRGIGWGSTGLGNQGEGKPNDRCFHFFWKRGATAGGSPDTKTIKSTGKRDEDGEGGNSVISRKQFEEMLNIMKDLQDR